jgi:hypothetical protein
VIGQFVESVLLKKSFQETHVVDIGYIDSEVVVVLYTTVVASGVAEGTDKTLPHGLAVWVTNQSSIVIVWAPLVHETQRLWLYPAVRSFSAVMSQGLEPPIFTGSFIAVEHPDSYNEHDVIGQLVVSELLKKTSQEVHELDMIFTSSEVVDESYDNETD